MIIKRTLLKDYIFKIKKKFSQRNNFNSFFLKLKKIKFKLNNFFLRSTKHFCIYNYKKIREHINLQKIFNDKKI